MKKYGYIEDKETKDNIEEKEKEKKEGELSLKRSKKKKNSSKKNMSSPPPKHNSLKMSDYSSVNNIKPSSEREIINQINPINIVNNDKKKKTYNQ